MICTDRCVFVTHRSVGWWCFCWAHLGWPTLDFTLVLNSDWSHGLIAPSFAISCYLLHDLLMIMERRASNPAHKIKPMALTRALKRSAFSPSHFPPVVFSCVSLFKSNSRFLSLTPLIHLRPYVCVLLFALVHWGKLYTSSIPQINPKISSYAFGLLNCYRSIYLNCLFGD